MTDILSPERTVHMAVHVQRSFTDEIKDKERRAMFRLFADALSPHGILTLWGAYESFRFWPGTSMKAQWKRGIELGTPARPGEPVFISDGANVLDNPRLQDYLRQRHIGDIIFSGLNTHSCVLNSLIGGTAAGFRCHAVYDCLADLEASPEADADPFWHYGYLLGAQTIPSLSPERERFFFYTQGELIAKLKEKPAPPAKATPDFNPPPGAKP